MALSLARRLPDARICLFLHNDPQTMRATRRPTDRAVLLRRLARVVTVSDYLRRRLLEGVAPPDRMPAILPNCIDLGHLPPSSRERDKTILFVGRVVPEKAPTSSSLPARPP